MEHNKISKLLNHSTLSRSVTRKWIKVNSKWFLSVNILSTKTLDLYDYSDAYIVLKRIMHLWADGNNNMSQKCVVSNDNAPFSSSIYNVEDFDIVITMYNLLYYSDYYSMTWKSLWNHYRDEVNNVNDNASYGKPFKYRTKIVFKSTCKKQTKSV